MTDAKVVRGGDMETTEMRWGRGVKYRLAGPERQSGRFEFHLNSINVDSGPGPYHYHEHSESAYYVLEGTVEAIIEGSRHLLDAGDSAYIPATRVHSIGSSGDLPARVIEVYAPGGDDFHIVESPKPNAKSRPRKERR